MSQIKEISVGGRVMSISTGIMASQADGNVLVRYGDTVVLVTVVADKKAREGVDFLPLTVDYRENTYAAGKIPGGFFKREGRPNEKEVLTSRLIDRPVRPLFPEDWNFETQVIALVLSADLENDPDVLAVTGASFALSLSDIPFKAPIAAVRVGLVNGTLVVNPTYAQLDESRLDLVIAGTEKEIVMAEAGAKEVTEQEMMEAIIAGHREIENIVAVQKEMMAERNVTKRSCERREIPPDLQAMINARKDEIREAMQIRGKIASYKRVDEIFQSITSDIPEGDEEKLAAASKAFSEIQNEILKEEVLVHGKRFDGRKFDEIRPIRTEVGLLPRTHGSALFTRGETQALVTATLGTSADAQTIDWLEGEAEKRFMLHYNFPPFCVGEVKPLRGPGRREIGHGALAEKSLLPLIPPDTEFPYTIRLVSDILESNGSSSMASICGGSLALMDAGVPVRGAVAGIAMGLLKEGDRFAILSDIAGAEDHHGDMDFKVAGTAKGITSLQMDIKIDGVTPEIMQKAFGQARQGIHFILGIMNNTIAEPRKNISAFAPRIFTLTIPKHKIGEVIGPGGKMIRSIIERTGAKIEIDDNGKVDIASVDEPSALKAMEIIKEITAEAEIGKIYVGKVTRIVNFGAFVEILPGVEGLLHISEIADYRIRDVNQELHEGDEVLVKVIDIDGQDRIRLSRKAAMRDRKPDRRRPEPNRFRS
ncbi:MAG: polyribonucleotide nucleotidyltransferase [Acidobacteriota bacterium]